MNMEILKNTQIIWAVIMTFLIIANQEVQAENDTQNILSNSSFDNNTNSWELDGTAAYDNNNYGELNKSVRFSGSDGGSITQSITLENIVNENQEVTSISGSLISIGCNNEGSSWCTQTGTANNLDPVNITITLDNGTNTEVLNHNFTSDYNDGVITTNYSVNVTETFETIDTSLTINYFGADTGNKAGQFGTIIDDLSLVLTLNDISILEQEETAQISQNTSSQNIINNIVTPNVIETVEIVPEIVQIGSLDANSIANTLSTGIIDITPPEDLQIASLSSSISVISDIRAEELHQNMADISVSNEMPIIVNTGADIPVETDIPDMELPIIDIDLPEIEMPGDLPEINNIEIEPVNDPEPETLKEIREELPEDLEEIPAELEDLNMEKDLEENIENENKEEKQNENEENVSSNDTSDVRNEQGPGPNKKEEIKKEKVKKEKKIKKNEKKEIKKAPDSSISSNKKVSKVLAKPKIKSDLKMQELDIRTIVSFNKEYFETKITDTLDLTTTEVDFYEQDGFNSNYAETNTKWNSSLCKSHCWGDMVSERPIIKVEQFRR